MKWLLIAACLAGGPLHEMDTAQIDTELRSAARANTFFAERLSDAARAALGTPYQDGPLGEGPGGDFDTDPMVDFQKVDCVT